MKNQSLLIVIMLFALTINAQVKVFPGGKVSVGTTNAPDSIYRSLYWGSVNIKQSNYNQTLLTIDALEEGPFKSTMLTNIKERSTRNYVLRSQLLPFNLFYVNGWGAVMSRGYQTWSDSTLKTQVENIDSALYKILQLHGVSYKYKDDVADTSVYGGANAKRYLGLLAQEVQAVVPEAVDTTDTIMSVNYPSLTGLLIEGIKDLDSKVTRMEYWQKDTATGNVYYTTGAVGIGTTTPESALDVADKAIFRDNFKIADGYDEDHRIKLAVSAADSTFYITNGTWSHPMDVVFSTEGGVGINTDNPIAKLHVVGNDTLSAIFNNGFVGIGTSSPIATIDVNGSAYIHTLTDTINLEWGDKENLYGNWNNVFMYEGGIRIVASNNEDNIVASVLLNDDGNTYINSDNNSGYVGIGSLSPTAKLHVYANYDAAAPTKAGYFYATGGSENYGIHAYASISTGNNYAAYLQGDVMTTGTNYTPSDEKLKTNIRALGNTLAKIKTLTVDSYEFNSDMGAKHNFPKGQQIGIMAQDIEKQWPMLVNTGKHLQISDPKDSTAAPVFDEFKVVNYTGLIPVLVKGIQELDDKVNTLQPDNKDSIIDVLVAENIALKKDVAQIKDLLTKFGDDLQYCCFNYNNGQRPTDDGSKLEQNNPNPFSDNTVIRYYIAPNAANASIRISTLNGTLLNTFKIDSKGAGQILISGNSLQAGTYVYELIVDGKQVDAKRMVLTY